MSRDEYKVHLKDNRTGRKSFTLVNAHNPAEAQRVAEKNHGVGNSHGNRATTVTSVEKTGRSF